jgi:hypothetical protein
MKLRLHSITIHHEVIDGMGAWELQLLLADFLSFHGARIGVGGWTVFGDLYVEPNYAPLIVPTYTPEQRFMH